MSGLPLLNVEAGTGNAGTCVLLWWKMQICSEVPFCRNCAHGTARSIRLLSGNGKNRISRSYLIAIAQCHPLLICAPGCVRDGQDKGSVGTRWVHARAAARGAQRAPAVTTGLEKPQVKTG